jgi:GTP pyrophosphokinase
MMGKVMNLAERISAGLPATAEDIVPPVDRDFELITAAAVFAAEAHAGQLRKELQEPYIIHPLRVGKMAAELGQSAEFIAAAYLHDVVEDTRVPMVTIKLLFPEETAALVVAMTKWWESGHSPEVAEANKSAYYAQILSTRNAPLLKILDRADNLHDFAKMARRAAPKSHKWAARYHEKTVEEFKPLLLSLDNLSSWDGNVVTLARARSFYFAALKSLEAVL